MLCKICEQRYAPFPEEDYAFVPPHGKIRMFLSQITFNLIRRNGTYEKKRGAAFRRQEVFYNNEKGICEECETDPRGLIQVIQRLLEEKAKL